MAHEEERITDVLQDTDRLDQQFAEKIWRKVFPELMRRIDLQLGSQPRRMNDEEDVAQNAMHSLFEGIKNERFERLENSQDLWRVLWTITKRKISDRKRKAMAQKRGGGKVRGESAFISDDELGSIGSRVADENVTPESVDQVLSVYDELLPQIKDAKTRETVMLRMQGYTDAEIAEKMSCSVSRISQRIAKVRRIWLEQMNEQTDKETKASSHETI